MEHYHGKQVPVRLLIGPHRRNLLETLAKKQARAEDRRVTGLIRKWVYDRLRQEFPDSYDQAAQLDESP